MRALRSYLISFAILAGLAVSGGAWLPQPTMVPLDIPAGVDPFPHVFEDRSIEVVDTPHCAVPERDAVCTGVDFRSVEVERPDRLLVPETVRSVADWRPLVERHFLPEDVERALAVIECESGGDPGAANPYSSARGLFQHLGSAWDDRAIDAGLPGADIFDPVDNIAVAAWLVYEGGGWSHWAASGHCW